MAKSKRHRSPSYPAIDLETAVRLMMKLYPAAKHELGADVIAEEWGYKSSKTASPQLASLKYFGLLVEKNGGRDRMLRLTDLALDIAVDPDGQTAEYKKAIGIAATKPTIHRELWDKWGSQLPPESEMRRYLEREREFNPKYVGRVIEEYKATISFAKLSEDGITDDESDEESENSHEPATPPASQAHNMGPQVVTAPHPATGAKQDVFTLEEGPVVLQWPASLSADSFEDLSGWWDIMLRKIKRSVASSKEKGQEE